MNLGRALSLGEAAAHGREAWLQLRGDGQSPRRLPKEKEVHETEKKLREQELRVEVDLEALAWASSPSRRSPSSKKSTSQGAVERTWMDLEPFLMNLHGIQLRILKWILTWIQFRFAWKVPFSTGEASAPCPFPLRSRRRAQDSSYVYILQLLCFQRLTRHFDIWTSELRRGVLLPEQCQALLCLVESSLQVLLRKAKPFWAALQVAPCWYRKRVLRARPIGEIES